MRTKTVRALIVSPEHIVDKPIVVELDTLQTIVGGYIEAISPNTDGVAGWHAYCNEEGKLQRLPMNVLATNLAHAAGWRTYDVLFGTVVFLGETEDSDGEMDEADVPEELLALVTDQYVIHSD